MTNKDVFDYVFSTMKNVIDEQDEMITGTKSAEHQLRAHRNSIKAMQQINRGFQNAIMVNIAQSRYGVEFDFLDTKELSASSKKNTQMVGQNNTQSLEIGDKDQ